MKIAIAVVADKGLDSVVDARFGRAGGFLIVGPGDKLEYITNEQNLSAAQGAGIQAAQHILDSGAVALVAKHCGPKAFKVLSGAGMKVYLAGEGTVQVILEQIAQSTLLPTSDADVAGHW